MEQKTKIHADVDCQELFITRVFNLSLNRLFLAYTLPEIIEQWMGTKVLKLENKLHGCYQFETSTPNGQVLLRSNGCIHEFIPNRKITRTFQMENTEFPVQLEYLEFDELSESNSQLRMHVVYKSVEIRDKILKLPFAQGINMAHSKLEETVLKIIQ